MNDTHPLDLTHPHATTERSWELDFFAVDPRGSDETGARPRFRCLSSIGCASTIGGCAFSVSTYLCVAYCAAQRPPEAGGPDGHR